MTNGTKERRFLRRIELSLIAMTAVVGVAACSSSGSNAASATKATAKANTTSNASGSSAANGSATSQSGSSAANPAPTSLTSVNFAQGAAIDHGVIFAALEKGYFANNGIKANVKLYPTGKEIINQIASGGAQFGVVDTGLAMLVVSTGVPIKIVAFGHGDATASFYNDNMVLVAGPHSGVSAGNIKSLKGKKIGLTLGTGPQVYLDSVLTQNGMSESDVKLQNMLPADMINALQQGSIDAFVTFEPTPTLALTKVPGAVLVQAGGATGVYSPGAMIASSSWISAHPEATKQVLAAFAQAEQLGRQDPAAIAEIDTHWIDNMSVTVAEAALKHVNFDPRMSNTSLAALKKLTVPVEIKYAGMKPGFDPRSALAPSYLAAVEKQDPQYFSDLPSIPADQELS